MRVIERSCIQLGISDRHHVFSRTSVIYGALQNIVLHPSFLPVCLALCLATRVGVLFIRPLEQSSDFLWYDERAEEIVSGSGYAERGTLTAFWPVGWPGFLAAVFYVTGPSVLVAQIANIIFSALTFALTALLGAALFRNRMVGRVAVLILTLYPNQISYVPLLSTEIFFEFLLLLGIYLLMQDRILPTLLAGAAFGIGTLTKSQAFLIPGFVLFFVFITKPSKESFFRAATIMCVAYIAAVLVILPWTYRNYRVFETFIPISTNGGWTLLTGNNPDANGDYTPETILARDISHDPAEQVAMDRLARTRAINWIAQNPANFLMLMPKKLMRLWLPDGEAEWFYQRGFTHYDFPCAALSGGESFQPGLLFLYPVACASFGVATAEKTPHCVAMDNGGADVVRLRKSDLVDILGPVPLSLQPYAIPGNLRCFQYCSLAYKVFGPEIGWRGGSHMNDLTIRLSLADPKEMIAHEVLG